MRIGFLSAVDLDQATVLSGMPYHMRAALEARGHRVTAICPPSARRAAAWVALKARITRHIPEPVHDTLRGVRRRLQSLRPERPSGDSYAGLLAEAERLSAELSRQIDPTRHDLLFGCCVSVPLYQLRTELPIVYYSDTTAELINATYPRFRDLPPDYHRATDELERTAMSQASAVVTATELARRSAVETYGVPEARTHVVPMGANVMPGDLPWTPPEPPTRASLRLVITAADPVRKQVDLAVEVVERLRAGGVAAELDVIGGSTPKAEACPWVRCAGYLKLSDPDHRRRNIELLANSHLMLLPSLGEAFGIAPGEAALVGRPSVVSDAGGLPEAVLHDETGIVLPVTATAVDYAETLQALIDDPERYRRLCQTAHARAERELTWDHWAARLEEICTGVLRDEARSL